MRPHFFTGYFPLFFESIYYLKIGELYRVFTGEIFDKLFIKNFIIVVAYA